MESNSLSKLPESTVLDAKAHSEGTIRGRKVKTNLSKWSMFCKVLKEEVHCFQRLVPTLVVFVLMYAIVSDATLGDHVIFATLAWGRYEW